MGDRCCSCHKTQPAVFYLICGECFHAWRTRLHLWWHALQIQTQLRIWRLPRRPKRILTCPCCAHDL